MRKIPLTQGRFALVDNADYKWLNRWKWCAERRQYTYYAYRRSHQIADKQINIRMHRMILGLKRGDKRQCDHRDHDGLNNQQSNLRICTVQQNSFNQTSKKVSSSKFKGVSWNKWACRWRVYIGHKGEVFHLGYFINEVEAAKAYDKAARKYHGGFASLNFNDGGSDD